MPAADTAPDTLLLCATEALARAHRVDTALARKASGAKVWAAPKIAAIDSWITRVWADSWPAEQLLSGAQTLALWERIVSNDSDTADVISKRSLAREAMRAAALIHSHGIDLHGAPHWTVEQAAFSRWLRNFEQQLAANGWITAEQLPAAATDRLAHSRPLPAAIQLDGFDTRPLTPSEQALLDAVAARGTTITTAKPRPAGTCAGRVLPDTQSQWNWLAADIRERLSTAATHGAPPPRIVVACADVSGAQPMVESALAPVIAPWLHDLNERGRPTPWRVDPATALADTPSAAALLAVARLRLHHNRFSSISRVLLCGMLWRGPQRSLAAQLEHALRDKAAPNIGLGDCVYFAPEPLAPAMRALREAVDSEPKRALPSAWAQHFEARAAAIGWQDAAAQQTSAAFQAAQQARQALLSLGSLDAQLGEVSAATAAAWLTELMARPFAPRAESVQAILVTDLEAAASLPADVAYLMDATDQLLPEPARRTPLIAAELQANLPGATPASQQARAQALINGLRRAPELIALRAAVDERGAQTKPLPLLHPDAGWIDSAVQREAAAMPDARLQRSADPVPAVADPHAEGVRGGTNIFSSALESPLIAVLRHRLGVRPLDEPTEGLSPMAQGSLIHAVLDGVWAALGDSATLSTKTNADIHALVSAVLAEELPKHMRSPRFPAVVVRAESQRALGLVSGWLTHERTRHDAFTVQMREQGADLVFEGLPLNIKVDRVDTVHTETGDRLLILDYKTSKDVAPQGWFEGKSGAAMHQPQLPLYATPEALSALALDRADGLAFAQVHRRQQRLATAANWSDGLTDADTPTRPDKRPFDDRLRASHATLRELARQFLDGDDRIQAKLPGSQHPLAALIPMGSDAVPDDDADAETWT